MEKFLSKGQKMRMGKILLTFLSFSILNGCALLPQQPRASTDGWQEKERIRIKEKSKIERENYSRMVAKMEEKRISWNESNPEVAVNNSGNAFPEEKFQSLKKALNALPTVTRHPGTKDINKVYVKVGGYDLPFRNILISLDDEWRC
ncbi:hypothetical protein [Sodalis sp. (in: enterobacteria)]|uniref:hypothetical protein n=1 Tax=Sodalis sp. (in: enterobacteria) TaxID=1898979 RepID=UPI003F31292D